MERLTVIPPLAEILEHEGRNGLVAASTFTGVGGSSLGLRWAGWSVPFASEFVPAAAETYAANYPTTVLDTGDIRDLAPATVTAAAGGARLDLLEGSPPCSPYSVSGIRERGWGEPKPYSDVVQRVDDLFDVWLDLAEALRPRALLAENVPSLTGGKTAGAFRRIITRIRSLGYFPVATVLDARFLGVPQRRKRLIIVAFSEESALARFEWPTPVDPTTVSDVIDVETPTGPPYLDPETGQDVGIDRYAIGPEWHKIAEGASSDRYFNLVRAHRNEPCPTVTQTTGQVAAAGVAHPTEPRKFYLAELRRLCGFPDDLILTGDYRRRAERLGRAVPPPMYRALGETLAAALRGDPDAD